MSREILIVTETRQESLLSLSYEAAAFGMELAEGVGGVARGVVLGSSVAGLAEEFSQRTGLGVLAVEHEALALYNADAWVATLARIVRDREPGYVIIAHTATGWDYAARLAVAVEGACVTGVSGIVSGDGLSFTRQICGGKVVTEVAPAPDAVAVVTVMPGTSCLGVDVAADAAPANPVIEIAPASIGEGRSRTLGYVESEQGDVDLSAAEVIVAVGRGLGDPEAMPLIEELASCFERGVVAASRPVVDAGWLSWPRQVGQTGQTVAPRLYLALGISGAIQHTSAIAGAELIVAVNRDPKAAIFNVAQLGVIEDLHQFVPMLIEKIKEMRASK